MWMWKIANRNVQRMARSFKRRIWTKTCRIQERKQGRMNMAKNWNTILRWVHLIFGFCFSIYFGAITFTGNIDYWDGQPWVTMAMGTVVLGIVFWTGIIKWQLPRIKKWNRNRKKSKVATNWFEKVTRGYPKPLCILFPDTKGVQLSDTDASVCDRRSTPLGTPLSALRNPLRFVIYFQSLM